MPPPFVPAIINFFCRLPELPHQVASSEVAENLIAKSSVALQIVGCLLILPTVIFLILHFLGPRMTLGPKTLEDRKVLIRGFSVRAKQPMYVFLVVGILLLPLGALLRQSLT